MGLSLQITDTRFDDDKVFRSLTLPFLNGLTSEFILRGSLAASRRNLAAGADQLTEISTPTWNESNIEYTTASANTGVQLTTNTTAQNTMVAVAEKGWSSGFLAKGGNVGFVGVSASSGCAYRTGAYSGVGNSAEIPNTSLPAGMVCFIGRGQTGVPGKISAWNAGAEVSNTGSANDGAAALGAMQLGGDDGVNSNGSFKVAYFAHFNRVLSDEECTEVYLSLKSYFSNSGSPIS